MVMKHFMDHAMVSDCNNEENIKLLFRDLENFLKVEPQLPPANKHFVKHGVLNINTSQSREDIVNLISDQAGENEVALLSLYTYRQMDKISWEPFIKAAIERNPVALEGLKGSTAEEAYLLISGLPDESVYDAQRLAQPDEVWNFGRGDGVEKAILLGNYLANNLHLTDLILTVDREKVILETGQSEYRFRSAKNLMARVRLDSHTEHGNAPT
jgi:hypothetical protein